MPKRQASLLKYITKAKGQPKKSSAGSKRVAALVHTKTKETELANSEETNDQPQPKKQSLVVTRSDDDGSSSPGATKRWDETRNVASWQDLLKADLIKPSYKKLRDFVESERKKFTIYPPKDDVFSWMKYCSVDQVKVVILGQDPYHGTNQAHGLCFSVRKGVAPPPSLVNIFKELESDITTFTKPDHGCLIGWARQGVLLLNAVLTVRAADANSHKNKGWEAFTDAVIQKLAQEKRNLVFMLWGNYAEKKATVVMPYLEKQDHYLLSAPHPSPLSAHRGWFGSKPFSQCNEILTNFGSSPINWTKLDELE